MNKRALQNISLIASIASCFTQIGAQLFAIVVIVRTAIAAPPRSFAVFEGEYGYDSSIFWQTVPPTTLALLSLTVHSSRRRFADERHCVKPSNPSEDPCNPDVP